MEKTKNISKKVQKGRKQRQQTELSKDFVIMVKFKKLEELSSSDSQQDMNNPNNNPVPCHMPCIRCSFRCWPILVHIIPQSPKKTTKMATISPIL